METAADLYIAMGNPQECAQNLLIFHARGLDCAFPVKAKRKIVASFGGLRTLATNYHWTLGIGVGVMQRLVKTIPARVGTPRHRWRAIWALVRWEFY